MSFYHWMARGWTNADGVAVEYGETALTWGELRERVARAAGWLGARGLEPGDVLALQMSRSLAFLELHLAALASGIATLPMNDAYTADEVRYLLADSGAKLAVLVDAIAAAVDGVPESEVRAALDAAEPASLDSEVAEDAIAAVCYTSGTTGRPKGALITHANLAATVRTLHEAWRWRSDDVLVHALPLYHIHGLFVAQHGALWGGGRSLWLPRFDPHAALKTLEERGGTVFMGVPTFYQRFLDLPPGARYDLSRVRLFTCGSAGLPAHVHAAFERRFGHRILERYGMTEVGIVVSNPYDGERRPGSIGKPLPGVEARVVDPETGVDVDPGEVGELRLRGPSVFQGYLGQAEKTAAAFADGWMKTGDLARQEPDGYLQLVGRSRDLVISGGLNVYPSEVEAVLAEHPDVAESAVVGTVDADLGERVVATVVPKPGRTPADLDAFARAHLAPYKCPKAWRLASELPRNAMGKVQKNLVRAAWEVPVVRDGRPEDAPLLARYNVAMALETEDHALDPDAALRGAVAVFDRDVGARYFVAEIAGAFAGQCMITTEWSDWRARQVWWLQSVYVLPGYRGKGVFRALYDHVLARAAEAGAAGLRLYVDRRNERAAAVYRKIGMDGDHYLVFERMFED